MRVIFWSGFLFVIWLALTMSLDIQEVIAGIIVSISIAILYTKNFEGDKEFRIKPIAYLKYLVIFQKELVLANIDVAKRVIDPKTPDQSGHSCYKNRYKRGL